MLRGGRFFSVVMSLCLVFPAPREALAQAARGAPLPASFLVIELTETNTDPLPSDEPICGGDESTTPSYVVVGGGRLELRQGDAPGEKHPYNVVTNPEGTPIAKCQALLINRKIYKGGRSMASTTRYQAFAPVPFFLRVPPAPTAQKVEYTTMDGFGALASIRLFPAGLTQIDLLPSPDETTLKVVLGASTVEVKRGTAKLISHESRAFHVVRPEVRSRDIKPPHTEQVLDTARDHGMLTFTTDLELRYHGRVPVQVPPPPGKGADLEGL